MTIRQLPLRTRAGLLTLAAAAFIAVTTETLPTGLLPQMARGLGVSQAHAGSLVAVYGLCVALGSIPLAVFTITWPRKPLVLGTLAAYSVSSILVAVSGNYAVAAGARVVGGLAHALFFAVAAAYVTRLVPRELVGRAVAATMSGSSLATLVGVPLGTAIGIGWGWRAAFALLAAAGVVLLGSAAWLLPPVASSEPIGGAEVWAGLRARGLAPLAGLAVITFGAQFVAFTYISPLLRRGGLAGSQIALALLAFGLAGMVGVWLSGARASVHPRSMIMVCSAVLAVTMAGLWASSNAGLPTVLLVFVWGLAFGILPSFIMSAGLRYGRDHPDISAGTINAACNTGIVSGSIVGGTVLRHDGLHAVPLMALAVFAAAVVLAGLAGRFLPRVTTAQPEQALVST